MNESDLQTFTQLLLKQKAELLSVDETSKEAARPVQLDQASVGRLSRMDAMQAQQMAQESIRRRESQLLRIEGALRRIESGNFGCCHVCGDEIDPRRLTFDPTLTRCLACKDT